MVQGLEKGGTTKFFKEIYSISGLAYFFLKTCFYSWLLEWFRSFSWILHFFSKLVLVWNCYAIKIKRYLKRRYLWLHTHFKYMKVPFSKRDTAFGSCACVHVEANTPLIGQFCIVLWCNVIVWSSIKTFQQFQDREKVFFQIFNSPTS